MTNPIVWKAKLTSFSNSLEDTDDGVIFPGQGQSKGKKEKEGFMVSLYEILIQHLGQRQSTLMSATSFPSQFDLEVFNSCCRSRCQVEPSLAVRCMFKVSVPEIWLPYVSEEDLV